MQASFHNSLNQVELIFPIVKILRDKLHAKQEVVKGNLIPLSEVTTLYFLLRVPFYYATMLVFFV